MPRLARRYGIHVAVLVLSKPVVLAAQDFRAKLTVTVADPTGSTIPAAELELRRTATAEVLLARTDETGVYSFLFLQPGAYSLKVSAAGFKPVERTGIVLQSYHSAMVTAEGLFLDTESASRGATVRSRLVNDLPVSNHNPLMLGQPLAGVYMRPLGAYTDPWTQTSPFMINARLMYLNEFQADGAPNNAQFGNNVYGYTPPQEAVQEVSVQANSYDAQYGRTSGGVINVSTESGTSQLHADALTYLKRTGWSANSFQKAPRARGLQVAGPLAFPKRLARKDTFKAFYLFSWDKYHELLPNPLNFSYPTASAILIAAAAWSGWAWSQQPDPPGQARGAAPKNEAYLFAHIMQGDYGRRYYYTVSPDGLHWRRLNGGKRVFEEYHGHPDICRGNDGRYYLIGNRGDSAPDINFWVSGDLIHWTKYADFTPDLLHVPNYASPLRRIGAPKMFYDSATAQYIVTWHTPHVEGTKEDPERYWASQRTLYVLSNDLKTFSAPRRLFQWEIATIDVGTCRIGARYYALLKDERYPTPEWFTGKTIRIASSASLTGPYSDPSPPVSPNFREAPMLIPSPDGNAWYLYYEQYPGVSYGLSVALNPDGPWYQISGYIPVLAWNKYELPAGVRHGCMLPISRKEYDALVAAFGIDPTARAKGTEKE